jgi:pimeloyl-ACP methyl ester carboxylesterase
MSLRSVILLLNVLLAGLLLLSCSAEKETDKEAETVAVVEGGPIIDSVASADGSMIHYRVIGQGEPTLVFVHCWECNMTYWDNQVDVFDDNHKIVLLDLAGHGTSGTNREDYTLPAYGQDVAAVVNKLSLNKFILIGHSMGGPVNIEAARILGDKVIAIIGVDTYADFNFKYPEYQVNQWLLSMENDFYGTTISFVKGLFPDSTENPIVERIAEDMASASPEVGISSMRNVAAYDYIEALKDVTAPFYLINADMYPVDTVTGKKYTSEFNVKILENSGHFLHLEKPEEFNQLLQATIEEITSKPAEASSESN